jgi:hypothetical protein
MTRPQQGASDPALDAPLPSPAPAVAEVVGDDDVRFVRGPRSYRVRGLARCLSAESLKVTLRLSSGERLHLDTLDLKLMGSGSIPDRRSNTTSPADAGLVRYGR